MSHPILIISIEIEKGVIPFISNIFRTELHLKSKGHNYFGEYYRLELTNVSDISLKKFEYESDFDKKMLNFFQYRASHEYWDIDMFSHELSEVDCENISLSIIEHLLKNLNIKIFAYLYEDRLFYHYP